MIFSKHDAQLIGSGRKTAHALLADPSLTVGRDYAAQTMRDRPDHELYGYTSTIVATGKTRRRRPRHATTFGRIHITSIRPATLADLTVRDAKTEGYRTTRDLYHAIAHRNNDLPRPLPNQPIWIMDFHLVRERDDRIRLLHKDSSHGYTHDRRLALPDEPEAVDQATQRQYTADAQIKPRVTQIQAWADSRDRLVAELERLENADLGRNIDTTLRALRRQIDRLDAKITRRAA